MDIEKLKVAELRTELANRGLDTKGTKPVLVTRLREFMEQQGEEVSRDESNMEVEDEEGDQGQEEEAEVKEAPKEEEKPKAETPKKEASPVKTVASPVKAVASPAKTVASPVKPVTTNGSSEATKTDEPVEESNETEKKEEEQKAKGVKRKRYEEEPFVVTEDEPEIDESLLCLDWFNSDLSLKIDKATLMTAEPLHRDSWGHVWSGARATHGFNAGKLHFEVKLLQNLDTKLPTDAKDIHDLRVGWSSDDTDMMLGESKLSFAFSATGKFANDSNFLDYGATFTKDDVIGCHVNLDSSPAIFTFSKNGETQGSAFELTKSDLHGKPIFPHICSKNIKFEVNFGKNKSGEAREPWFAAPEGFVFVAEAAGPVRGTPRIASREECEMIMMVGLPSSGKTTWANKHVEENPGKKYTIIGTSALIDKMKVNGESLRKHCANWQTLIQNATKCLSDLLRLASTRRRNYIIDQTNVFANAQRRKIRPFQGMIRKAVVIVPSDEDYKARVESQDKDEAKEVPESGIMEMKANFELPSNIEESDKPLYDDIVFVDLDREEAAKVVEEYNKDAKEKGFGKRYEQNQQRKRMRAMMHKRGGRGMRGNVRGAPFNRFQRGMPFRGIPPRGFMRGGPPMRGGAPFGGPRGGQNRGGNFGGYGGGNQRFQGNKFSGHGGQGGHWGQQGSWQQQAPMQRQGWGGGAWNANGAGAQATNPWSQQGGGQGHGQSGYGNQSGWGYNSQQGGYPGSQNWGGYNR